jgi:hypothetical protein
MQNTTHGADGARALFAFLGTTDTKLRGAGFVREAIDAALAAYPGAVLAIEGTRAVITAAGAAITLECAPLASSALPPLLWRVSVAHDCTGHAAPWRDALPALTRRAREIGAVLAPSSTLTALHSAGAPAPESPVTCEMCHDSHRGQLARPCHVHGCECYCNRGVRP